MTNVIESLAKSYYEFYRSGVFASDQSKISILSMEDAYAVQRKFQQMREADGDHPFGYKVGCTSASIRRQFGFDDPIYGRLMTPDKYVGDVELDHTEFYSLAIEPEFVLTMKRDVSRVPESDDELLDAIDYVQPGIELHNYVYHYDPPSRQELICSNGIHAAQVIGEVKVDPRDVHWTLEGVAVYKNQQLVASGVAAEIMEGPLNSLRFLLKHLAARGEVLKAGELVIPGSATPLIPAGPGDKITCCFTNLGEVSLCVT